MNLDQGEEEECKKTHASTGKRGDAVARLLLVLLLDLDLDLDLLLFLGVEEDLVELLLDVVDAAVQLLSEAADFLLGLFGHGEGPFGVGLDRRRHHQWQFGNG